MDVNKHVSLLANHLLYNMGFDISVNGAKYVWLECSYGFCLCFPPCSGWKTSPFPLLSLVPYELYLAPAFEFIFKFNSGDAKNFRTAGSNNTSGINIIIIIIITFICICTSLYLNVCENVVFSSIQNRFG